jgi:hypothetical protein
MIEEVFETRKNDSRFIEEKGRILALGIFRLMLFPNLTRTINSEVAAAFVAYENTHINPTIVILAKTILTLSHYKRVSDTTKRLMSSPKCRSVEVINNPARPGSNHREVNCINYR